MHVDLKLAKKLIPHRVAGGDVSTVAIENEDVREPGAHEGVDQI